MSNDDRGTRTLAIAALIIACVSLVVSLLIGGVLLLKENGEHAADSALPQYLSEKRLAGIAESIVEPFNAGISIPSIAYSTPPRVLNSRRTLLKNSLTHSGLQLAR
jgi:hypothetical protein